MTRFMRLTVAGVIGVLAAAGAQAQPRAGAGQVTGVIRGDDGRPIGGVVVTATRQPATPSDLGRFTVTVRSGADGRFTFPGLAEGTYRVCPQLPRSDLLNPCQWSATPPTVTVGKGQDLVTADVPVSRGFILPVRVEDPAKHLRTHEGKTRGAHLMIGVSAGGGRFQPAALESEDADGRNYTITVPFEAAVNLRVHSDFFQFAEGLNPPVAGRAAAIPVQVLRGQQGNVTLRVTGVRGN